MVFGVSGFVFVFRFVSLGIWFVILLFSVCVFLIFWYSCVALVWCFCFGVFMFTYLGCCVGCG